MKKLLQLLRRYLPHYAKSRLVKRAELLAAELVEMSERDTRRALRNLAANYILLQDFVASRDDERRFRIFLLQAGAHERAAADRYVRRFHR